jgi:hypothetical protein
MLKSSEFGNSPPRSVRPEGVVIGMAGEVIVKISWSCYFDFGQDDITQSSGI